MLRKVWKWNIWQISCNLAANVTNDAIKVGAPSYKLLLNPASQTLYQPHFHNYYKSTQKGSYAFRLKLSGICCDIFGLRSLIILFVEYNFLWFSKYTEYYKDWEKPLLANKNNKSSSHKTFEWGIFLFYHIKSWQWRYRDSRKILEWSCPSFLLLVNIISLANNITW